MTKKKTHIKNQKIDRLLYVPMLLFVLSLGFLWYSKTQQKSVLRNLVKNESYGQRLELGYQCFKNGAWIMGAYSTGEWGAQKGKCLVRCKRTQDFQLESSVVALEEAENQFCRIDGGEVKKEVPGSIYFNSKTKTLKNKKDIRGIEFTCPGSSFFYTCEELPQLIHTVKAAKENCCH